MTNEFDSLLDRAKEIRDAVYEGENTAERVGSMFVELLTAASEALYGADGADTLLRKLSAKGLLTPGDALAVEHKGTSASITIPSASPDGTPGSASAVIGAVGNKAGLMLPAHVNAIDSNSAAVTSIRKWVEELPVLAFAGTVEGATVSGLTPGRIQLQTAHAQGLTAVVFDTLTQKFLLRIASGESFAYYETWYGAGDGETALRPHSEYAAGCLFSNGGILYAWDGPGSDLCRVGSLAPRMGQAESRLSCHEERLGDLVYKTNKLRTDTDGLKAKAYELRDNLASAARMALDAQNQSDDNAAAIEELRAAVAALGGTASGQSGAAVNENETD